MAGGCASPQAVLFADSGHYARELWVDPGGSDDADGTADHPWHSLRRAGVGRAPGDRVHVRAGTYYECLQLDGVRGTAAAPVAFTAEGLVQVSSEDCDTIGGSGVQYVLVQGFEVVHAGGYFSGIHFDAGSHHLVVRRNHVHDVGNSCVKINQSDDVWILDNDLHDVDPRGASSHGVDLVGVHRGLVRGNHVHDIRNNAGGFAKGGSEDVVFERNLFERITSDDPSNSDTIALVLGGQTDRDVFSPPTANYEARRLIARNNVIELADGGGIGVDGCHDCLVASNTLWNTGRFGYAVTLGIGATGNGNASAVSHAVNARVVDNLVINPLGTMRAPIQAEATERQGLALSHNLWWNGPSHDVFDPGYNAAVGVTEPRSLVDVDPRVVDPDLPDLHLLQSSPARAAGVPVPEVSDDYDGTCRTGPTDLGAYGVTMGGTHAQGGS